MTIDIKDFYLNTTMPRYEHMRLKLCDIPEDIALHYNLASKFKNDRYVYTEIRCEIYGLTQLGLLAQQLLERQLNIEGYSQYKLVPGIWTHSWSPVAFNICLDDFGVKYVGKQHLDHLMTVLSSHYTISSDWTGSRYLRIDLDWDYEKREVQLTMLSYVQDALTRFHHYCLHNPQDQPYPHAKVTYGSKAQ